jgi:tetratricopeptide (TPR) repeat protein
MSATPMSATPVASAPPARPVAGGGRARLFWRLLLGAGILVLLFAGTYLFAWLRANNLGTTFMADANASYEQGNYIGALTGYEEFNEESGTYVTRGGYMKVQRIWASQNAWPVPSYVDEAQVRIREILNERMTIEEAEGFIQANIGRPNPYMGEVFLRLGELYAAEGDEGAAEDIFEELPELFPNEPELIERAEENLTRLEGE